MYTYIDVCNIKNKNYMIIYNDKTIYLLNKINNTIIKKNYIKKNQRILISISGGQDSICMFFILFQLKKQWNWAFGIIFCNHLWQQNSFYTAFLIIKLAYIFKIPIYYEITSNTIFSEYRSRNWRYSAFYRISFFYNYEVVTTGHTSSDKIETILFQLMRGTSTKNLTCLHFKKYFLLINRFSQNDSIKTIYLYNNINLKMSFVNNLLLNTQKLFHQNYLFLILLKSNNDINYNMTKNFNTVYNEYKLYSLLKANKNYNLNTRSLIRPVLHVNRFDLKKLSLFWNLPLYPDKTNQSKHYYRNRIRKQLLPTLRFFFNPQIDNILLQFAEITTTEQLYFNVLVNQMKYKFQLKKYKIFHLQTSLFYGVPLSIQRKLIKEFLENHVHKQTSFFHIEYILQKISQNKKFYELPFTNEASSKIITSYDPKFTFGQSFKLTVGFAQKVAFLFKLASLAKTNVLQNKFYRNYAFSENHFLATLCFANISTKLNYKQNNTKNHFKNGFSINQTTNYTKTQFILLANNSMKNSVQNFFSPKHLQSFLLCKNIKNKYLFKKTIFINQHPLNGLMRKSAGLLHYENFFQKENKYINYTLRTNPKAFASKKSPFGSEATLGLACRVASLPNGLFLLGNLKGKVFVKKNSFNFKKLTLPFGSEATCRVDSLQKNAFFYEKNFYFYQKKVNFFISGCCYFNTFQVLFFPKIGILLNFSKNIIFLQT